jgi:hypothetical protein
MMFNFTAVTFHVIFFFTLMTLGLVWCFKKLGRTDSDAFNPKMLWRIIDLGMFNFSIDLYDEDEFAGMSRVAFQEAQRKFKITEN